MAGAKFYRREIEILKVELILLGCDRVRSRGMVCLITKSLSPFALPKSVAGAAGRAGWQASGAGGQVLMVLCSPGKRLMFNKDR